MNGIYLHIPFCKQACSYCNFHFSTQLHSYAGVVRCMQKELRERKDFFPPGTIADSIYFGGGTPSLLEIEDLKAILQTIRQTWGISPEAEVTLEANPDDVSPGRAEDWLRAGVNRVSLGMQSFSDEVLQLMNRSHNSHQAKLALKTLLNAGFQSISADLIYAVPTQSIKDWQNGLQELLDYYPHHFSAYALSVEPQTLLDFQIRKGKLKPVEEADALEQFTILQQMARNAGYHHYEVSGFARDEYYAKHNSGYWNSSHYLGVGPGAHSYNGESRRWNVANNHRYIRAVENNEVFCESEILSPADCYNEYIMTRLRTDRGVDLSDIEKFSEKSFYEHFLKAAERYLQNGSLVRSNNRIRVADASWFVSDSIIAGLFHT